MKPGRELDALVAEKVFGCKPSKSHGPFFSERNKEAKEVYFCSCRTSSIHDEFILEPDLKQKPPTVERVSIGLKKYSTSILAAWEVVEKIKLISLTSGPEGWFCRFGLIISNKFGETITEYNGRGITAPHAICLAALKTVGIEE